MQIIEVKNDLAKVLYEPLENPLMPGEYVLVSDDNQVILALVTSLESAQSANQNIADIKFMLTVDETGKINPYTGYTPSKEAQVIRVDQNQVTAVLSSPTPIRWGYLAQHNEIMLASEMQFIQNNPLILVDNKDNYQTIISNIISETLKAGQKNVVLDFDGSISFDNAFYINLCEDLKIPLSFETLNYVYENDIKEESLQTQAVVQDIIIEIQEYIKTLPEGFLPFETIKNVVHAQYEENKIPELMILKNKFLKYSQEELFAQEKDDFEYLNSAIAQNNLVIIDASALKPLWHRLVLEFAAQSISQNCNLILKLDNTNSDRMSIQKIYKNLAVKPILASTYEHKEINTLKSIAKNLILFAPIKEQNDFATYNAFMSKLYKDEFVICGENTLYLPFIVKLTYLDTNLPPSHVEQEIISDVDSLYTAQGTEESDTSLEVSEDDLDFLDAMDENFTEEPVEAISETKEEAPAEIYEQAQKPAAETIIMPEPAAVNVAAPASEPVITPTVSHPAPPPQTPPPPPIPIYSTPEPEVDRSADFKEGNFVYHEKYGKGVIEKIMTYGNKTLCSIQFDEVGRRLLDPNLAGLKQV